MATSLRRTRERDIIDSARAAFDERGVQEAAMEEIARSVGINRALIYRYFESKDELFVLTVTRYLDELTARGIERIDLAAPPVEQLRVSWANFTSYCREYPAFLDCALSLMRQPAADLRQRVSERTWFRLGESMSACLAVTIDVLRRGVEAGAFRIADPTLTANCMYAQTLGMMHLARTGIAVGRRADEASTVSPQEVEEECIRAALAAVGVYA